MAQLTGTTMIQMDPGDDIISIRQGVTERIDMDGNDASEPYTYIDFGKPGGDCTSLFVFGCDIQRLARAFGGAAERQREKQNALEEAKETANV